MCVLQPDSGGIWIWKESGTEREVELHLSPDGSEVAEADQDEPEGTPQYYWEQTSTSQESMPGIWRKK